MDEVTQWMRILGGLAMVAPILLSRIAGLRPYGRQVGLVAAGLYLATFAGFLLWWWLIRPSA